MKKYTTLDIDVATLATEAMAHLNSTTDVEDAEHQLHAFHVLGTPADLANAIPSLSTTFSSLTGLTPAYVGHFAVTLDAMFNNLAPVNMVLVPIDDCENAVVKFFDVAVDAVATEGAYADADCTLTNTVPLTSPVFVKAGTTYTIETSGVNLADVLLVILDGNADSYFA